MFGLILCAYTALAKTNGRSREDWKELVAYVCGTQMYFKCHDVCRWSLQAQVADWNAKLWRSRVSRRSDGRRNELRKPVSP
jgi:hypothetical protein